MSQKRAFAWRQSDFHLQKTYNLTMNRNNYKVFVSERIVKVLPWQLFRNRTMPLDTYTWVGNVVRQISKILDLHNTKTPINLWCTLMFRRVNVVFGYYTVTQWCPWSTMLYQDNLKSQVRINTIPFPSNILCLYPQRKFNVYSSLEDLTYIIIFVCFVMSHYEALPKCCMINNKSGPLK